MLDKRDPFNLVNRCEPAMCGVLFAWDRRACTRCARQSFDENLDGSSSLRFIAGVALGRYQERKTGGSTALVISFLPALRMVVLGDTHGNLHCGRRTNMVRPCSPGGRSLRLPRRPWIPLGSRLLRSKESMGQHGGLPGPPVAHTLDSIVRTDTCSDPGGIVGSVNVERSNVAACRQ